MANSIRSVSNATLFQTLVDASTLAGSDGGKEISAAELQAALGALTWDNGTVTAADVIAVKSALSAPKIAAALSPDARAAADAFESQNSPTSGGLTYERRAVAFDNLTDYFRYNAASDGGAKVSLPEAHRLLDVLGASPAPARVAQVEELRNELVSAKQANKDTLDALTDWLGKNPIPAPDGALGATLAKLTAGQTWTSETDAPIYPVQLDKAPASLTLTSLRTLLGEPTKTTVATEDLADAFAGQTDVEPGMSTADLARAKNFQKLQTALGKLTDVKAYRVGDINMDLYVLGRTPQGKLAGIVTRIVET